MRRASVLLIDDDEDLRRVTEHNLRRMGLEVAVAPAGEAGLTLFKGGDFDLVITDIQMPGMGGMEVIRQVKRQVPDCPVLVITAYGSVEGAVEAVRLGAADYLEKPFSREVLQVRVERCLEVRRLTRENIRLKQERDARFGFEGIVGRSGPMMEALDAARRVAASDATVLLLGESGTGKELVARAIHGAGPRKGGPFVTINCSAIPAELLESELFGHEKGAFTGAIRAHVGKFEQAEGGSVFLDEIGDMRGDLQAKLLRVLQEREIERVGGKRPVSIDCRVIAATNRDLRKAVGEKAFREDLYYRISVVPILLPPLRQRPEDIPFLAGHFLRKYAPDRQARFDAGAMDRLTAYAWPGNVRELENAVERALIFSEGDVITEKALPPEVRGEASRRLGGLDIRLPEEGLRLEEVEQGLIAAALERFGGNQTKAAAYLGITRPTLIYRMEKYGLKS